MEKERKQNKSAVWIMAAVILIASCAIGFSVYKGLKAVSMGERVVTVKGAAELGFTDDEIFVGKVSYDEYTNDKTKYVRGYVRLFVKSKAIEKVQTLEKRVTELYERGVVIDQDYWDDGASYEISDVNVFKPKLITESMANAKKAGEQFAKDAESKLGKMKTAWQGQISIEDLDETTPHIKKCRVVSTITYYLED